MEEVLVRRSTATRPSRRTVSMVDVAAHAQVSQKTVSRVVNMEPHVREEVRLRVQNATKALGFRPDAAALVHVPHVAVSRVVTVEPLRPEEVRWRAQKAFKELGFRPNAPARSLRTRRPRRAGIVALRTTFYGPLASLSALEAVARAD